MSYQPFLIAPFGTGLDTDISPWLLPQDAFSEMVNAHIHHGVVEKRSGFTKFGDIVYQDQANWKITGVTAADPAVIAVTSAAGLTNGDIVEIRNVVGTTELNGNQYTITAVGGANFTLANTDGSGFTAWTSLGDVYLVPQARVMGIERYIDSDNVKEVLAFDTARVSKYNPTNDVFNPVDSADIMSGSDTNYIWADNWASTASSTASTQYRLYFTNGKPRLGGLDGIYYYDGGNTTTSFAPLINGGRAINGCKLLFAFQQRLLLLHTFEASNTFPQRARWCQAQGPSISDAWDDNVAGKGGYVDAPTGDHIISAQLLQNRLIVFFTNSVWSLSPTADPALAFRWDRINDFRSCDAKMSTVQFDRYVMAMGIRGITITDGVETQRADERIEDFVEGEINDSQFEKIFSRRSYGQRKVWMLYPSLEASDADGALIYDEESSAYSKYDIDLNVLGYGGAAKDSAIDDFGDKTLDKFEESLNDFFFDEGSEIFLGGNRTGEIYTLEQSFADDEVIFESDIENITNANPGVVRMTDDVGLVNGDLVTLSGIVGMTELNGREFFVVSKSGNEFALLGENTTTYTGYTSDGAVRSTTGTGYKLDLTSAAWNPWMSEGKQSQMGYLDLFVDTHPSSRLMVDFFVNNDNSPYRTSLINLLPNMVERSTISEISNANPGSVSSGSHGLTTGDQIYIYTVEGMEAVNGGPYTVTVTNPSSFTIGVDTSDYGDYTANGVVTELPFSSTKAWKRIYAGGSGYQHKIRIRSEGIYRPVSIHAFMPWFKPRSSRPI